MNLNNDGYEDNYADALGIVHEYLVDTDAKIVGSWPVTEEYFYEESRAVVGDVFVGLALDEDNQDDLSEERIIKWCENISKDIL